MRVAFVGAAGDGGLAGSLADAARRAGHEAALVDAPKLVAGSRALIAARKLHVERIPSLLHRRDVRRELTALEPELIIVVKGRFLGARDVRRLRRDLGVPVINYYPDHPLWPGYDDREILDAFREYDEVIVWGEPLQEALSARELERVRVVRFAYDPEIYRPPDRRHPRRWDAVLIGQHYPERLRAVETLVHHNVLVSGAGWPQAAAGGPLDGRVSSKSYSGTETCALYWSAAAGVNILAAPNVPSHNMRSFELPASGTPMIATRTPVHEELFGEDGAMLVSSPDEVRAALEALLQDDELRRSVGRRGREAVEPHTYDARIAEILEPWISSRAGA